MIDKPPSFLSYTGHGMIERYPKNMSLIYVTGHERRHKVNNQLKALATGKEVSQTISYKVTISGGKLIAVQGETQSVMRDRGGNSGSSPELPERKSIRHDSIVMRGQNRIMTGSFRFMRRDVPGVLLNHGTGSALKAKATLNALKGYRPRTFLDHRFQFHPSSQEVKNRSLNRLENRLKALNESAGLLAKRESFSPHRSRSDQPSVVEFNTTFDSPDGKYKVRVSEIARGGEAVSAEVADPFAPLGLSGSFNINGYAISVHTGDSLNDIKDFINYGEDVNRNGELDLAEDINGNGRIESFIIKGVMTPEGFLDSFFYFEDVDFSGTLEPSEDLNDNELLDGGTGQIQVEASIERNRLVLRNTFSSAVHLSDDDGILKQLDFFTDNPNGVAIREERQLLQDGENLNKPPQKANLEIDGKGYRRGVNTIHNIIPSTIISIKKVSPSSIEVSIFSDFSGPTNLINNFVQSYNDVISSINRGNLSHGLLATDPKVQDIRSSLVRDVTEPASSSGLRADGIGIKSLGGRGLIIQGSLSNLRRLLERRPSLPSLPAQGIGSLLGRLERMGITGKENDTLTIDQKKLSTSLKKELGAVMEILSGKTGISGRITHDTRKALNPRIGTLRFQRDITDFYTQNPLITKTFLSDIKQVTNAGSAGEQAGSLVDSLV